MLGPKVTLYVGELMRFPAAAIEHPHLCAFTLPGPTG